MAAQEPNFGEFEAFRRAHPCYLRAEDSEYLNTLTQHIRSGRTGVVLVRKPSGGIDFLIAGDFDEGMALLGEVVSHYLHKVRKE